MKEPQNQNQMNLQLDKMKDPKVQVDRHLQRLEKKYFEIRESAEALSSENLLKMIHELHKAYKSAKRKDSKKLIADTIEHLKNVLTDRAKKAWELEAQQIEPKI